MSVISESTVQVPASVRTTETVGAGLSSRVHRLNAVAKCYTGNAAIEKKTEIAVYERLRYRSPWHKGIMQYYGLMDGSVILQFAQNGTVRQYLGQASRVHISHKLRWAEQATDAIAFLHSHGILHSDISCNNIFLDEHLNALVGDFGGSSLDGEENSSWYEIGHCHPDAEDSTVTSEIFALGSTYFEMLSGQKPFEGLDDESIEDAIRRGEFPSLGSLPALQAPIAKCWHQEYESVDELLEDVKEEARSAPPEPAPSSSGQTVSIIAITLATLIPLAWWMKPARFLTKA
ncbi:hypothetical protein F66182_3440 [Fusarium sp. NRRL 66182]|nr:hypothetical protein F66182_3440 [Fusarium sp. NRRL 66182]